MRGLIQLPVLISTVLVMLLGNAWGGWFSFEPNMQIKDGTPVARELTDIQKETAYREKGDTALAEQLVRDSKVLIMDHQKYDTRVEYVKYEEQGSNIFVLVKDESGSKMWANMAGLACRGTGGGDRPISKADLVKGEFPPLADKTD